MAKVTAYKRLGHNEINALALNVSDEENLQQIRDDRTRKQSPVA
jgi:hypothetical protein